MKTININNNVIICYKCGSLAYWNSHFQGYKCQGCGIVLKK